MKPSSFIVAQSSIVNVRTSIIFHLIIRPAHIEPGAIPQARNHALGSEMKIIIIENLKHNESKTESISWLDAILMCRNGAMGRCSFLESTSECEWLRTELAVLTLSMERF